MAIALLTSKRSDEVVTYDTVTGLAFGPVWPTEEHAEAFLKWLAPKLDAGWAYVPTRNLLAIDHGHFQEYRDEFMEECVDEDGELKAVPV